MEENRIWELIAKKQAGEASPEEQLELNQHCSRQPGRDLLQQVEALWSTSFNSKDAVNESEIEAAWNLVEQRIGQLTPLITEPRFNNLASFSKRSILIKVSKFIAAACFFSIAAVTIWWLLTVPKPSEVTKNIVTTRNGSKTRLELPDGSKLWLNSGSRITYNQSFGKNNRDVQLIGEAYFDVTHNKQLPFIIYTRNIIVKVVGTVFNIKAYAEDNTTEASLVKGIIEVSFPGRPTEKLILHPSQKITIINSKENLHADSLTPNPQLIIDIPEMAVSKLNYNKTDSSIIETSWIANKLIFRNKQFDELVKEMERWFNVEIEVQNDQLLEQKFTGTFYSGSTVTEALEALKLTYPFSFRMDSKRDKVIISSQ